MDDEALEALRRGSGLRLDGEGRFHHHGAPVANPRVQTLFHQGLRLRDDGELTLHVGTQWAYVVRDTPTVRFARRAKLVGDRLELELLDGGVGAVSVAEGVLAVAPDHRFYAWPAEGSGASSDRSGAVRLLRDAHHALAGVLAEGATGGAVIQLPAGGSLRVRELASVPEAGQSPPP